MATTCGVLSSAYGCQSAEPTEEHESGTPSAAGSAASAVSEVMTPREQSTVAAEVPPAASMPAGGMPVMGNAGPESTINAADAASSGNSAQAPSAPASMQMSTEPAMDDSGMSADMATSVDPVPTASATGTLPAVSDFKSAGPYTPIRGAGPSGYALFYPQELGKDGVKHPILSWGPGAVETASDFDEMLNHIASHGFAVISFDATPQGQELVTGIDWMISESMRADSMFYEKLDTTKIAAGGHSAGSLATFVVAGDERLVTTLHISGGTFDPHTDIENLRAPALFVCGEPDGDGLLTGDVARPNCDIDFMNAAVPVFYGVTKGASHMTPTDIGEPAIRVHQLGAMVGWLRWQLAGDERAKGMFIGDACTLCTDAAWSKADRKNWN